MSQINTTKECQMVEKYFNQIHSILKENLISFYIYGSLIRGDFVSGKSDINILIILNCSTPEAHRVIAEEIKKFPRITSFVLSKWEFPRSGYVFASKFKSIGRYNKLLFGEDFLKKFSPDEKILRFLSEQSLRNIRLRIEHAYIHNFEDPKKYSDVLIRLIPSIYSSLSEVLRCGSVDVPADRDSRPEVFGKIFGYDAAVMKEIILLRRGDKKIQKNEMFEIHSKLYKLLSAALDWIRKQWNIVI